GAQCESGYHDLAVGLQGDASGRLLTVSGDEDGEDRASAAERGVEAAIEVVPRQSEAPATHCHDLAIALERQAVHSHTVRVVVGGSDSAGPERGIEVACGEKNPAFQTLQVGAPPLPSCARCPVPDLSLSDSSA